MFERLFGRGRAWPKLRELIHEIPDHFDKIVGSCDLVLHERVSDRLHIDVYPVPASDRWPWVTLYTTGMAMRPMNAAAGQNPYSELLMLLPADWDYHNLKEGHNCWPVRVIKRMARLPHEVGHCVSPFVSAQFFEPPVPEPGTPFVSAMYVPPEFWQEPEQRVQLSTGQIIELYVVVPLTLPEMLMKAQQQEASGLWRLARDQASDPMHLFVADPSRPPLIAGDA